MTFNTTGNVTFTSSTVKASLIKFIGIPSNFTMDSTSKINATGKGNIKGLGYGAGVGGSYGGQGGSQSKVDYTYGNFDQIPDNSTTHINQMGSGGGDDAFRGGGVVVINTTQATINGKIEANGIPTANKIGSSYNAGSGGYIYIKWYYLTCNITGTLSAEGGLGSDDKQSNSGSGGRIVLDNVIISSDKYSVSGGWSNFNSRSYFNGAGGTIYFVKDMNLTVKNSLRWSSDCITPIDPLGVQSINYLFVYQSSFSFKVAKDESTKAISTKVSNMYMDNQAELSSPLQQNDINSIYMNISHFTMNNATIKNTAVEITIASDIINLTSSSMIKYHSKLELYASKLMILNGTIMQNEVIASQNDNLMGTVNIYAGDPLNLTTIYK